MALDIRKLRTAPASFLARTYDSQEGVKLLNRMEAHQRKMGDIEHYELTDDSARELEAIVGGVRGRLAADYRIPAKGASSHVSRRAKMEAYIGASKGNLLVPPSDVMRAFERPDRAVLMPIVSMFPVDPTGSRDGVIRFTMGDAYPSVEGAVTAPSSQDAFQFATQEFMEMTLRLETYGLRYRQEKVYEADAQPLGLRAISAGLTRSLLDEIEKDILRAGKPSEKDAAVGELPLANYKRVAAASWEKPSDGLRQVALSGADWPTSSGSTARNPVAPLLEAISWLPDRAQERGGRVILPPASYRSLVGKVYGDGKSAFASSEPLQLRGAFSVHKADLMADASAAGDVMAWVIGEGSYLLGTLPGFPVDLSVDRNHGDQVHMYRVSTRAGGVVADNESIVAVVRG